MFRHGVFWVPGRERALGYATALGPLSFTSLPARGHSVCAGVVSQILTQIYTLVGFSLFLGDYLYLGCFMLILIFWTFWLGLWALSGSTPELRQSLEHSPMAQS